MTYSDRFPVPVRSAIKSNFTAWCCQKLSKHALNSVQASKTSERSKKTAVQIVKPVTSATNCFATLHYLHAVVENVQKAYEYANCHQQGHAGSRTLSIEIHWLIKGVPANAGVL